MISFAASKAQLASFARDAAAATSGGKGVPGALDDF
jgi:hypothetical protein